MSSLWCLQWSSYAPRNCRQARATNNREHGLLRRPRRRSDWIQRIDQPSKLASKRHQHRADRHRQKQMPCPICATGVQPLRELDPESRCETKKGRIIQKLLPQSLQKNLESGQSKNCGMNGKILVISIGSFFLLFFVIESWLMRVVPHWYMGKSCLKINQTIHLNNWTSRDQISRDIQLNV